MDDIVNALKVTMPQKVQEELLVLSSLVLLSQVVSQTIIAIQTLTLHFREVMGVEQAPPLWLDALLPQQAELALVLLVTQ